MKPLNQTPFDARGRLDQLDSEYSLGTSKFKLKAPGHITPELKSTFRDM